jgi:hypothetical protein
MLCQKNGLVLERMKVFDIRDLLMFCSRSFGFTECHLLS